MTAQSSTEIELEEINGYKANEYLERHSETVNQFLETRIPYFDHVGCILHQNPTRGAYLVIALTEDCPHPIQRGFRADTRNYVVENQIMGVLADCKPFPEIQQHSLLVAFTHFVVVKKDSTSRLGYARVSWAPWIQALNGEYGDAH